MNRSLHRKELVVHGALLVVLLALLFPRTFLAGEVPLPGDILFRMAPWSAYAPEDHDRVLNDTTLESLTQLASWSAAMQYALDRGEWPLWNPFEFAGMPLLANCQSAVLYPPRALLGFLDLLTATTVLTLLKMWLCGFTAYVCGRGIGLSVNAARFFSVCWMLGGYTVLWCYWQMTDVAAWIPVVFLGAEWIVDGRYRKGFFCLALGGTLILLAGHPETAFTFCLGVGIYFVLRVAASRRGFVPWFAPVGAAAAAWGLALLVCMALLVPFFEYLPNSFTLEARAEGKAITHFFDPASIVGFWVPRFFGSSGEGNYWGQENSNFISTLYPGMPVWIAVFSLLAAWGRAPKARVRVLCLLPGIFLSLALAYDFILVKPLNDLPIIQSMWGIHHAAFAVFAVPLVGAIGVDQWFRKREGLVRLWPLWLPAGLTVALVAYVFVRYTGAMAERDMVAYAVFQCGAALSFGGLAAGVLYNGVRSAQPGRWAGAFVVLLAVDLLVTNRNLLPTTPREHTLVETELTNFLQKTPEHTRVNCETARIPVGIMPIYGIRQAWAYDGIFPGRMMRFWSQGDQCPWERLEPLLALEYYLVAAGALPRSGDEKLEYVTTLDRIDVFRNRSAFPHAFLTNDVHALADAAATFEAMCTGEIDLRHTALLETGDNVELNDSTASAGVARVMSVTSASITVEVNAEAEGVLVVSEAYYPGWKASVDGQSAEVFPAYHAFRAVLVPEGEHVVVFTYEPLSFRLGLWVSIITLASSAGVALYYVLPRRRGRRR